LFSLHKCAYILHSNLLRAFIQLEGVKSARFVFPKGVESICLEVDVDVTPLIEKYKFLRNDRIFVDRVEWHPYKLENVLPGSAIRTSEEYYGTLGLFVKSVDEYFAVTAGHVAQGNLECKVIYTAATGIESSVPISFPKALVKLSPNLDIALGKIDKEFTNVLSPVIPKLNCAALRSHNVDFSRSVDVDNDRIVFEESSSEEIPKDYYKDYSEYDSEDDS